MRLDDLDRKIIALLVEDGRLSFADGVVRRFTAEIDSGALGWTIEAFVELYCEGRVPPEKMRALAQSVPEVVDAYTVTGEADGIVVVRAECPAHSEEVLGVIRNYPGVSRTRSAIVLSHL